MNEENNALLEAISKRFKLLSDSNRLLVLSYLKNEEMNVTQIIDATGLKQENISKILNFLAQEKVVGRRKEGNSVYYHIEDESIFELCSIVCENLQKSTANFAKLVSSENPFLNAS